METTTAMDENTVENAIELMLSLTEEEYHAFLSQSWREEPQKKSALTEGMNKYR